MYTYIYTYIYIYIYIYTYTYVITWYHLISISHGITFDIHDRVPPGDGDPGLESNKTSPPKETSTIPPGLSWGCCILAIGGLTGRSLRALTVPSLPMLKNSSQVDPRNSQVDPRNCRSNSLVSHTTMNMDCAACRGLEMNRFSDFGPIPKPQFSKPM